MTKAPAIADYGLIGDCRAAALISRGGSIDWLCWPRFDSPSLFASLIDRDRGGSFSIGPAGPTQATRRYLPETNILETLFEGPDHALTLTDLMPVANSDEERRLLLPEHEILRILRCERGAATVEVVFDPRPDYARRVPRMREAGKLGLRVEMPRGLLVLRSEHSSGEPVLLEKGRAKVLLKAGEELCFSLTFTLQDLAVLPPLGDHSRVSLERTARVWRSWAARTIYTGEHRDQVVRSALLLKLLAYAPSGAIVAAPTTSLPERPGGDLNWDYRYCWLRDAALTARALFGLGHHEEAEAFVSWLLNATSLSLPKLNVLYDVFGRQPGPEHTLDHLAGHQGARPVRVGNAAAAQTQLDVYGEVIEAAAHFVRSGNDLDRDMVNFLIGLGRQVCESWRMPDDGIWEARGEAKHYTHSLALSYTGLDRLLELHRLRHLPGVPVELFATNRALIRAQVDSRGYSESLQSYTRTLGGTQVDASLLLLSWYGYEKASSARMRGTYRQIQATLSLGRGLLRRYDGPFTTGEGAFGICGFWAAEFLALGGGTLQESKAAFAGLLGFANDLGLYAEEIDAQTGALLGNFPQAYTHVGLINAALSLHERTQGKKAVPCGLEPSLEQSRAIGAHP